MRSPSFSTDSGLPFSSDEVHSDEALIVAGLLCSFAVFWLVLFSVSVCDFCGFVQADAFSLLSLAASQKKKKNEPKVLIK